MRVKLVSADTLFVRRTPLIWTIFIARLCGKVMFSYCLSVQAITFEHLDLESSIFGMMVNLDHIYGMSSLSIKVIGSNSFLVEWAVLTVRPQILFYDQYMVLLRSSRSRSL